MAEVTTDMVLDWVDAYERAWRSPGTDALSRLFTDDATYVTEPYADPLAGLDAIAAMWEEERAGPDEVFTMTWQVVSCSDAVAVVHLDVRYGDPVHQEYRDLWVLRFAPDGRVLRFEEWPFWPGHGRSPRRPAPAAVVATDMAAQPWAEWLRSAWLSAGVYRIPAGGADEQQPHGEDEVYVVVRGRAVLDVEGERLPVQVGTLAFVPAYAEHRFVDIEEDLEVAVVFAPPEGSRG